MNSEGENALPAASAHVSTPVSWMQTIPTYMPWSTDQGNSKYPSNTIFTAEPSFFLQSTSVMPNPSLGSVQTLMPHSQLFRTQQKRKGSHFDDEFANSNKIYISEEKMIAHMNELCISNNNSNVQGSSSSRSSSRPHESSSIKQLKKFQEIEERLSKVCDDMEETVSTQDPVLILAPELRKLQKADTVLPSSVLQMLPKPSMELVLWKPPGGVVDSVIKSMAQAKMHKSCASKESPAEKLFSDVSQDRIRHSSRTAIDLDGFQAASFMLPVRTQSNEENMDTL